MTDTQLALIKTKIEKVGNNIWTFDKYIDKSHKHIDYYLIECRHVMCGYTKYFYVGDFDNSDLIVCFICMTDDRILCDSLWKFYAIELQSRFDQYYYIGKDRCKAFHVLTEFVNIYMNRKTMFSIRDAL